jgi:hypothetical protein
MFRQLLGEANVEERPPIMGGEDFSQFTRAGIRTFYWHLGVVTEEAYAASKKPGGWPSSLRRRAWLPRWALRVWLATNRARVSR